MRIKYTVIGVVLGVLLSSVAVVLAGSLDSPSPPSTTESYTLEDIWNRLDSGAPGTKGAFTEPGAGPETATMHTLNEIMDVAPVQDNTDGASNADVLPGKTFWGLTAGQWGPQTGALTAETVDNTTVNQAAGYYEAFDLSQVDTDLKSRNVVSGVSIFGVDGHPAVVDTRSGGADATAAMIGLGRRAWVNGELIVGTSLLDCEGKPLCFDCAFCYDDEYWGGNQCRDKKGGGESCSQDCQCITNYCVQGSVRDYCSHPSP